jgi:hypothetical protein
MILRHEWQQLTDSYLSLDGSHMLLPLDHENIIILREPTTIPCIESIPSP